MDAKFYFLDLSLLSKEELMRLQVSIDQQLETGESGLFCFSNGVLGEGKLEKLKRFLKERISYISFSEDPQFTFTPQFTMIRKFIYESILNKANSL